MKRLLATLALVFVGCAHGEVLRPFPDRPTMWTDHEDEQPFSPRPADYQSSWSWDAADQMAFRPTAELFLFRPEREAINVNAMDEVPNSSWYHNRASVVRITPREFIDGPCRGIAPLDTSQTLTIISAKPDGGNPGFMVEDSSGRRFLVKFDDVKQPTRTTTAEVFGSRVYWAAGFHVPCNNIVAIDRSKIRVKEGVTVEIRLEDRPLDDHILDTIFDGATRLPDGRFRASSSFLLPGEPIGAWRYEGVRDDDPNDVIPHEERRELRGSFILAAWLLHFDSREQNTLAMWVDPDEDGEGFIRHHLIDFGDCLGSSWTLDALSKRNGFAAYFDAPQVLADFVTLGAINRPWRHVEPSPAGSAFGYFETDYFMPERYRSGYRNPAFDRATERDLAWMTRIVANITPAHIRAAVDLAELDEWTSHELTRVLLGRRQKILERWLTRISPLTWPSVAEGPRGPTLCLRDVAVEAGVAPDWDERQYWARAYALDDSGVPFPLATPRLGRRAGSFVCADLPTRVPYLVLDVGALNSPDDRRTPPARVHLRLRDDGSYRVAGIERPTDRDPPVH